MRAEQAPRPQRLIDLSDTNLTAGRVNRSDVSAGYLCLSLPRGLLLFSFHFAPRANSIAHRFKLLTLLSRRADTARPRGIRV